MSDHADVAVVVTYFEQPDRLRSILRALDRQEGDRIAEIVVADDGSSVPPDVTSSRRPVTVVRQDDRGARPGRARNLGASTTSANIVVFLDGDTVPEPSFVRSITEPLRQQRADIGVGHRAHADFDGLTWGEVADWVAAPTEQRRLAEPGWLADGYRSTADLTDGSPGLFRYVISAVLAVRREVLQVTGGFDPGFDTYGGEDWEFANRCWCAGFDFAHVPRAIAHHDGPDWAGRSNAADPGRRSRLQRTKTLETIKLAGLVADGATRGRGVIRRRPDTIMLLCLRAGDPASNAAMIELLLDARAMHAEVRLVGDESDVVDLEPWITDDPRIVTDARSSCRHHVAARVLIEISDPVVVTGDDLARWAQDVADGTVARRRIECSSLNDGPSSNACQPAVTITITSLRHRAACQRRLGRLTHGPHGSHLSTDGDVSDADLAAHAPVEHRCEVVDRLVVFDLERWLADRNVIGHA